MPPEAIIRRKQQEGEQEIILRLLEDIADDGQTSQAKFADRVGIAKGLANAYFKRCLRKGWIKLQRIPRQRYMYYITPIGFLEKARLSAEFLTSSYRFYRQGRADLVGAMTRATADGHHRLAVLGSSELAEIAVIVGPEASATIVGFIDGFSSRERLAGLPVVKDWAELEGAEAAVLATVEQAKELRDALRRAHPDVPIYIPTQLQALLWEEVE